MTTRIKTRHDTAANWLSVNPLLALGEAGFETDTRKVKYGDGVTVWSDLLYASEPNQFDHKWSDGVNDNTWHVVTVTGAKEFDYDTPGHKYTIVANTATLTNVTSYSVDSTVYDMEYVDIAVANGSNIHIYVNNDHGSRVNVDTVTSGSTYTFTLADPISANPGDEVTIEAWYRGTQQVWDRYDYWNYIDIATSVTATNTIVVDTTHYQQDPGWAYMWEQQLPNNVTDHSIIFDEWHPEIDARAITSVTTASNGLVTITFDGPPKNVNAIELNTITTTPTNAGDGSYNLYFSKTEYPQFKDCVQPWQLQNGDGTYVNSTGNPYSNSQRSGYVVIDGGMPINFQFYRSVDDNDNWYIDLYDQATWTSTSTLEIHWYRRGSNFALDIYDADPEYASLSDGYKWFDWRSDLPQVYQPESRNGVQSGRIMAHCKVYAPEVEEWDQMSFNLDFYNTPSQNYYTRPYDPVRNQYADNLNFFGNSRPFSRFNTNGIGFKSYFGPNNDWTTSTRLKVRIIYKMELIIAESSDNEYYC
jgi:hypothetical protein